MSAALRIAKGNLEPDIEVTATANRVPMPLTGATSVEVYGVLDDVEMFRNSATTGSGTGTVIMQFTDGDTDVPGYYTLYVDVVWPGNRTQTFEVDRQLAIYDPF